MTEEWLMLIVSHVSVLVVGIVTGYNYSLIHLIKRIKAAAMIGYTFGVRDHAKHQVAKDVDEAIALVETEMKQKRL